VTLAEQDVDEVATESAIPAAPTIYGDVTVSLTKHSRCRADRELHDATQSATDLAASFNEPEPRVEARLLALASEGRIKESAAIPGRWMIA
jgi:hypothetical protein